MRWRPACASSKESGTWPAPYHTLTQTTPGDLPDTVVAAIRIGFRRLSPDAQRVLATAAALGGRVTAARLSKVTGLTLPQVHGAADELEWQRWLVADGRGYVFVAGIVERVVERDMLTPGQRRRIQDSDKPTTGRGLMDNVCHTLVGAALAQTGLKRRSPLATATLLIAANLPDVDVISLAWGSVAGLGFRRGWTHGVLALALWPFLLAGVVVLFDRSFTKRGARFWPLVGVSAIGVASHPLLDLLNTYGVRWLMPFSERWFYGDTLFIVDVWVWIMLAVGVLLSARWERQERATWTYPARAALVAATIYTLGMFLVGRLAESQVRFELRAQGVPAVRVLASPRPVTPLSRDVVVDEGDDYLVGSIRASGNLAEEGHWPKHDPLDEDEDPAIAAAAATPGRRDLPQVGAVPHLPGGPARRTPDGAFHRPALRPLPRRPLRHPRGAAPPRSGGQRRRRAQVARHQRVETGVRFGSTNAPSGVNADSAELSQNMSG